MVKFLKPQVLTAGGRQIVARLKPHHLPLLDAAAHDLRRRGGHPKAPMILRDRELRHPSPVDDALNLGMIVPDIGDQNGRHD